MLSCNPSSLGKVTGLPIHPARITMSTSQSAPNIQRFLHLQPLHGARDFPRSTPWPYPPISVEGVKKNKAMSFLFQRPEHVSSPTSPHSKRTSLHYIGTMASAPLKIRTPEEAGTLTPLPSNSSCIGPRSCCMAFFCSPCLFSFYSLRLTMY